MAHRPSRSSSIPIPRSSSSTSPTRNIETVISIPFASPTRTRVPSGSSIRGTPHSAAETRAGSSHPFPIVSSSNPGTSPVRSIGRSSFTQPAPIHARAALGSTYIPSQPRIVRAESSRHDSSYPPSTSPSNVRKPSIPGLRTPSAQRTAQGIPNTTSTSSTTFERPSYLDHSALRHLLQTETPSSLPPSRKADNRPSNTRGYSSSPSIDSDEESTASPPPRDIPTRSGTSTPTISPDQALKLPTRWSDQFKHHILNLSSDGRELTYSGTGNTDREREAAAAARTVQSIPPACGIYYFEVEIRSKDEKAHISVGFAGSDVRTSRLPGWEPNSWGYHGDDGCSFAAEKNGTKYGPTFGLGDVIGCGIDFTTHKAFYTKNGDMIGPVFDKVGKGIDLYPSVGLQHVGESVKVNFGHEPFKFNIEAHVQQQRNQTWTEIIQQPIDPSFFEGSASPLPSAPVPPIPEEQTKQALNRLVLSYLAHHGYVKTARAFQKQAESMTTSSNLLTRADDVEMADAPPTSTSSSSISNIEHEIELRTKIINSVLEKDIDAALNETKRHYPAVLDAEDGLMSVKLRCRKFIELYLNTREPKQSYDASVASGVENHEGSHTPAEEDDYDVVEEPMEMEVDDEDVPSTNGFGPANGGTRVRRESSAQARYRAAMSETLAYGQSLQNDYKKDQRPEVQQILTRTFSIVAYPDPVAAGGSVAEVAGNEARVQLANEVNQAILKSQGKPTHPPLEMVYRHTAVYLLQLGLSGVGAAAFADLQRELLDS
ncbi:hypothetical protein PQX77_020646 [Marasmius sp. AFHP31]|nr:hypothetical protein PQX77_020646 [Marasmius sp. AFHP31]